MKFSISLAKPVIYWTYGCCLYTSVFIYCAFTEGEVYTVSWLNLVLFSIQEDIKNTFKTPKTFPVR